MIWAPSRPVEAAIVASFLLPTVLIALSHGPLRINGLFSRFLAAGGATLTGMMAFLVVEAATDWSDLLAALLLFAGSFLAAYTLWSLIAWGFTIAMMRVAAERGTIESIDAWCRAFAGKDGIVRFASDRCGLLFKSGFAVSEGEDVVITARGLRAARIVTALRQVFGIGEP